MGANTFFTFVTGEDVHAAFDKAVAEAKQAIDQLPAQLSHRRTSRRRMSESSSLGIVSIKNRRKH